MCYYWNESVQVFGWDDVINEMRKST